MNEKQCWSCSEMIPRDAATCQHCNARQSLVKRPATAQAAKAKGVKLEALTQEKLLVMMLESQDRLLKSQKTLHEELKAQTKLLRNVSTAAAVWLILFVLGVILFCVTSILGVGSLLP